MIKIFAMATFIAVFGSGVAEACPKPPGFGFIAWTTQGEWYNGTLIARRATSGAIVAFNFLEDESGAAGDKASFQGTSDSIARIYAYNKRTPAEWEFAFENGPCAEAPPGAKVFYPQDTPAQEVQCAHYVIEYLVSPAYVYNNTISYVTWTGDGMDTTYGAPLVELCDFDENVYWSGTGSVVGNQLQVTMTLGSGIDGSYMAFICNMQGDGTYGEYIGGSNFTIYNNP